MNKLEDFLMQKYEYTRSKALFLIKNRMIYVNANIVTKRSYLVSEESEISVKIPTLQPNILWKDCNLSIVYKPGNMVSERCSTTSMIHSVLTEEVKKQLELQHVFALHRIDKDTSGIMALALNTISFDYYKNLMKERKFTKAYKAFYENKNFSLNEIKHFECEHGKMVWSYENKCLCNTKYKLHTIKIKETLLGVKLSENGNKICETLMSPIDGGYDCILVTGRTHQIRLTMKSINRVISGDGLYGSKDKCTLQLFAYYIDIDKNLIL